MTGLPPGREHPAKQKPPSGLRREYRPSSADNECMLTEPSVQVYDSQTVVPETQFEYDHNGGDADGQRGPGDPPLTPTSAAFVDKVAVKKGPAKTESSPFTAKLLAKENYHRPPDVGFSWAPRVGKAPDNAPAKAKSLPFQPIMDDGPTVGSLNDVANQAGNGNWASKTASPPASVGVAQGAPQRPDASHARHDDAQGPMLASLGPQEVPVLSEHHSNNSNQAACDESLPSAQPIGHPPNASSKVRDPKKKKKKKIRKASLPNPGGAPWPPRSSSSSTRFAPGPNFQATTAAVPCEVPSQSSSLPSQHPDDHNAQVSPLDADDFSTQSMAPGSDRQLRVSAPQIYEGEAKEEVHLPEPSASPTPAEGTHEEATVLPHQSLVDEIPHLPSLEPFLPMEPEVIAQTLHRPDRPELEYIPSTPRSGERHNAPQQEVRQIHEQQPEHDVTAHLDYHGEYQEADAQGAPAALGSMRQYDYQHRPAETFRTASHGQERSWRVEKPPKSRRVVSGPRGLPVSAPARSRAPAVQSAFEQGLESLQLAWLAEKSQKDHEQSAQAKHFDELKISYEKQIEQWTATAADWKDRFERLDPVVGQLCEKAKTNQKYVSGLQKDYEKLQKSAASQQAQCKKILQEKISEVENEKEELRRDFERTVDTFSKSQRNLRQTIDELYMRFVISESKRKDLAENMSKQVAMYEEEKAKRTDVEKQLLSSVRGVQRQLGDHSTQLIEKLRGLQTMIESAQAADESNSDARQCLVALRQMQSAPFLTTKDLEKAAGMLRFVHEGIAAKFDTLVHSVDGKTSPNQDLQTFVQDRLQELRSDMLRFDEVVADSRKAQEANVALNQKVEAEQQHVQQSTEQIRDLQQREKDLKAQQVQLECQLASKNDEARRQEPDVSGLNKEIADLRQRLKTVEEEKAAKQTELEKHGRNMQKRDRKLADYEQSYETLKEKHEILVRQLKEAPQPVSESEIRGRVMEQLQREASEKESKYKTQIRNLSTECEGLKARIGEHEKALDTVKSGEEEAKRELAELHSQLDAARDAKDSAETRANTAEKTAHDRIALSSEVEKLKERLRIKTEDLQSKVEECEELTRSLSQITSEKTELVSQCEEQQEQISQHASTVEALHQKYKSERDLERTSEKKVASSASERARNEKQTLEKEKEDLQVKLQDSQAEATRLRNRENAIAKERDDLRSQKAELEFQKVSFEAQLSKSREDKTKKAKQYEETVDSMQREKEQSEAALKEAEVKLRRQEAEHQKKLEFDRGKYAEKLQSLVEQIEALKASNASKDRSSNKADKPAEKIAPSKSLLNIHVGNNRKKVNRTSASSQKSLGEDATSSDTRQQDDTGSQDPSRDQNLFDEESQYPDDFTQRLNEPMFHDAGPADLPIEDTQDTGYISFSNDKFIEESAPKAWKVTQKSFGDSTDQSSLSEMSSDKLEQLNSDVVRQIKTPKASQDRVPETPRRSDIRSITSAHDRPRSQANTASRMMPPPSQSQRASEQGISSSDSYRKPSHDKAGDVSRRSQGRSPVFVHPTSSASERTYGQHDHDRHAQVGYRESARTAHKRKNSVEEDLSPKKQRTSSKSAFTSSSGSINRSSSSSQYPIRSSASGMHSRTQLSPSVRLPSSATSRSRAHASRSITSTTPSQGRVQQSPALRTSRTTRGPGVIIPSRQTSSTRRTTRSQSVQKQDDRFAQEFGIP